MQLRRFENNREPHYGSVTSRKHLYVYVKETDRYDSSYSNDLSFKLQLALGFQNFVSSQFQFDPKPPELSASGRSADGTWIEIEAYRFGSRFDLA